MAHRAFRRKLYMLLCIVSSCQMVAVQRIECPADKLYAKSFFPWDWILKIPPKQWSPCEITGTHIEISCKPVPEHYQTLHCTNCSLLPILYTSDLCLFFVFLFALCLLPIMIMLFYLPSHLKVCHSFSHFLSNCLLSPVSTSYSSSPWFIIQNCMFCSLFFSIFCCAPLCLSVSEKTLKNSWRKKKSKEAQSFVKCRLSGETSFPPTHTRDLHCPIIKSFVG